MFADETYYWFETIGGTSTFKTHEKEAASTVTITGLEFRGDLGVRAYYPDGSCASIADGLSEDEEMPEFAIMRWGWWGGGQITINNSFGQTVIENIYFIGGVVIEDNSDVAPFGKGTGMFVNHDWSFQLALPDFEGFKASQQVEGDGLLKFNKEPKLVITDAPDEGTAVVESGKIKYTPNVNAEGGDSLTYKVITQLGDTAQAKLELGTMDLDAFDASSTRLTEVKEDNPGLSTLVNNNDDNLNSVEDMFDTGFNDPDLRKLELAANGGAKTAQQSGLFRLTFDSNLVRVWFQPNKKIPLGGTESEVISNSTGIAFQGGGQKINLWVESIGNQPSEIVLHWSDNTFQFSGVYDKILVNPTMSMFPVMDLDIDSDNTGEIERTSSEDLIENATGQGKKIVVKSAEAIPLVLDANQVSHQMVEQGNIAKLVIPAGLTLWADEAMTQELRDAFQGTAPEDKTLVETYRWNAAQKWPSVVYVTADVEAETTHLISWRLETPTAATLAFDTVRVKTVLQNVLIVGVDGTWSRKWLEGPEAKTRENFERWTSHTRNLVELDIAAKLEIYRHGPDDWDGDDSNVIYQQALDDIIRVYEAQSSKPKIAIFGFSRGAMISLWLANSLAERGIQTDIVLLMDPVDMTMSIPESAAIVRSGIKKLVIFGPEVGGINVDHLPFERMSQSGRISAHPWNSSTEIVRFDENASHGAFGGAPGYNDRGEIINYDYALDRSNSIFVHNEIVRQLRSVGIEVLSVNEADYGFPLLNPTRRG